MAYSFVHFANVNPACCIMVFSAENCEKFSKPAIEASMACGMFVWLQLPLSLVFL